jgi:hypothetical protein
MQLNGQLREDDGGLTDHGRVLQQLDIFFTAMFTAELLANAFAHWWTPFVREGW